MSSLFNANFGNSALNAAYDMMILDEIKKENKKKQSFINIQDVEPEDDEDD